MGTSKATERVGRALEVGTTLAHTKELVVRVVVQLRSILEINTKAWMRGVAGDFFQLSLDTRMVSAKGVGVWCGATVFCFVPSPLSLLG